jgi:hypothetical protein
MSDNPYQSPQTAAGGAASLGSSGTITETMVVHLKGASPWLRFLGIIGFIGCGFLGLSGIIMLAAMPALGPELSETASRILGRSLGAFYLVLGVAVFFPALFTYNFGARLRNFIRNNAERELELAFKYNKSYWKFSGIMTIISLAIIPVAIVIGVIAGLGSFLF